MSDDISEAEEVHALVLYLHERGNDKVALKRLQQWHDEDRTCAAPECNDASKFCAEHMSLVAYENIKLLNNEVKHAVFFLEKLLGLQNSGKSLDELIDNVSDELLSYRKTFEATPETLTFKKAIYELERILDCPNSGNSLIKLIELLEEDLNCEHERALVAERHPKLNNQNVRVWFKNLDTKTQGQFLLDLFGEFIYYSAENAMVDAKKNVK